MQLAGRGTRAKPARVARRHAATLAKLERAERALVRAFNRWAKLRAAVLRHERELDMELGTTTE